MTCRQCESTLTYLHGHGTCVNQSCQLHGLNLDECCQGAPLSDREYEPTPHRIVVSPETFQWLLDELDKPPRIIESLKQLAERDQLCFEDGSP